MQTLTSTVRHMEMCKPPCNVSLYENKKTTPHQRETFTKAKRLSDFHEQTLTANHHTKAKFE